MIKTQTDLILDYLLAGNTLTSLEALHRFQCFRLASRISELKQSGYDVQSETVKIPSGKHVSKYWIRTKIESKGQLAFNLV